MKIAAVQVGCNIGATMCIATTRARMESAVVVVIFEATFVSTSWKRQYFLRGLSRLQSIGRRIIWCRFYSKQPRSIVKAVKWQLCRSEGRNTLGIF